MRERSEGKDSMASSTMKEFRRRVTLLTGKREGERVTGCVSIERRR